MTLSDPVSTDAALTVPSTVDDLADRFWEALLELSPTTATIYGDERYDDRWEDPGAAGRARARALFRSTLAEAVAISTAGLTVEERITRDMLQVVCELGLEQDEQRIDRLKAVDQINGPQTVLPQLVQFQRTDTPERLERFLARLASYPAFMAANADLVREGLATGLTAPRIVTERTIAQLERNLAVPPEASPVAIVPRLANEADRDRIVALVRDAVRPADAAFLETLRGDYLAASRLEPGLWSAPGGDVLYRTQIRAWTSLPLSADELHRVGLEELAALDAQRRAIAGELGHGDDVAAARAAILADPADVPASGEALVARGRERVERATAAAGRAFGRLPAASCDVRPVEPFVECDAPPAFYFPPAADGSRPGIFYVNTYDLPSRRLSRLASIAHHEAVPGHHFQISLEMEHPSLPAFRRLGSRMTGAAFAEGWGLYSERLADELGLYDGPVERLAMLDAQAWRAVRLVVDTGIHALRWSRERSIELLIAEAGLTGTDAGIETDRYIVQPGQALAYKVGQREIEQLRRAAEAAAAAGGRPFDLRAFHDAVLGHGSLPLATLARELPRWLAEGTPAP